MKNFSKNIPWSLLFITIICIGILGGAFIYYRGIQKSITQTAQQLVEVTPAPTSMPTKEPEVRPSEVEIIILNGSGIAGAASKAKEFLESEGFVILSIGDADNYNYDKTLIQAGNGINEGFLKELKTSLAKDYAVSLDTIATLDDSVTVIIGSL